MKFRHQSKGEKIETQMAPMIDVVFQLLIFFMLTLKIIEPEGDFDINMPLGAPAEASVTDADLPPFKVRLLADPATGQLTDLQFNGRSLGTGDDAFRTLNDEIRRSVERLRAAGPGADKQEVEIEPDFNLDYRYVISSISAVSGTIQNGQMIRFISRIKFAPIRPEQ
ncbi:MAG: biopolymer transporter ExbD [Planctomycetaceae bacterium]